MAVTWGIHLPLTDGLGYNLANVGTYGPSGNAYHFGCNWVVDGTRGLCLEFDGLTSYAATPRVIPDMDTYTIAGWIKIASFPESESIVACFEGATNLALYVVNDGSLKCTYYTQTVLSADSLIATDTWYHVALVRDTLSATLYIDGSAVGTGVLAQSSYAYHPVSLVLGSCGKNMYSLNGYMQNFRYSPDVAEAADIAALYTAESTTIIPQTALQSIPPDRNNLTLVFDESTGAWSKYDVGFDFLSGYRNSQYEYAILGARQGYVHEIDVGDNDGASVNEGYATLIGDVDSGGIDNIVDNSAAFQTLGDGLAGCRVFARADDESDWQERTIIGNYATKLYVDRPFIPSVNGGEYVIAPIDFYWESRWMDLGDPAVRKRIYYLQAWLQETDTTEDITVKYKTEYDEDWNDTTLSTDDEFAKILTPTRGRKVKLRFEHIMPNEPVEIESFQFIHAPKRFN